MVHLAVFDAYRYTPDMAVAVLFMRLPLLALRDFVQQSLPFRMTMAGTRCDFEANPAVAEALSKSETPANEAAFCLESHTVFRQLPRLLPGTSVFSPLRLEILAHVDQWLFALWARIMLHIFGLGVEFPVDSVPS